MRYIRSSVMQDAIYSRTSQNIQMKNGVMQANPADVNAMAEALIRQRSIRMIQQIYSNVVDPANTPVLNIPPVNVGLILGFMIECTATLADPGDGVFQRTQLGPANMLSQIVFNDLSNVTRVQTSGAHLHMINSNKGGIPFLAARTNTNYPVAFGDNMGGNLAANQNNNIIQAADVYSTGAYAQGVQTLYWLPIAYNQNDMRGAIFANVVNANMQIQLTINPSNQAFVAAAADPMFAVYQRTAGTGTGAWGTQFTVKVYQVYYDQIPVDNRGQYVLPQLSMAVQYDIKNQPYPGIVANNDFPISYSNFRDFLSTVVFFQNPDEGVYAAKGSDVAYWAHRQANTINIFKYEAKYPDVFARASVGDDYPNGVYYFDSRTKPISTVQFGNQQLILNASTVNANANVMVGFEAFAYLNTIVGAGSLSSGT